MLAAACDRIAGLSDGEIAVGDVRLSVSVLGP